LHNDFTEGKIRIRELTFADYGSMVKIWKRAGLPVKLKGRESKESIEKQMEETPDLFFGAEEDGELVGVIIASTEGRKGWLNRIAVVPERRGRGIAKEMTAEAEKALERRGIKIIGLLIHKGNKKSISLARSTGYIPAPDILYLTKRKSEDV